MQKQLIHLQKKLVVEKQSKQSSAPAKKIITIASTTNNSNQQKNTRFLNNADLSKPVKNKRAQSLEKPIIVQKNKRSRSRYIPPPL